MTNEKKNPFTCTIKTVPATFKNKDTGEVVNFEQVVLVLPYPPFEIKIKGAGTAANVRLKDYFLNHKGE